MWPSAGRVGRARVQRFVASRFAELYVHVPATTLGGSRTSLLVHATDLPAFPPTRQPQSPKFRAFTSSAMAEKTSSPIVGVIRLDYDYPAAPGDIDHPESFGCKVVYRVVPGLTFEMCQTGTLSAEVESKLIEAVQWLDARNVCGITGDCGFMMFLQDLARQHTRTPVFISSLVQLPTVTRAFDGKIAIFTANDKSLAPMQCLLKRECGIDTCDERFVSVGFDDVPGFEAVALGTQVDVVKVMPGVVSRARSVLTHNEDIQAIVIECTEMPPYANALRASTGLPVFDAITCVDFFVSGRLDNPKFGIQGWQEAWDGRQNEYTFAMELEADDQARLVNPMPSLPVPALVTPAAQKSDLAQTEVGRELTAIKRAAPVLGILCVDHEHAPVLGDVDHPDSLNYTVVKRVVPGMTLAMCEAGIFPEEIKINVVEAIKWLDAQNVSCITSNCGYLLWLQDLACQHTRKPVFLSSLVNLPAINCAFGGKAKIAIFTSNGEAIALLEELIKRFCAVDPSDDRFVIVGCENVSGFEAVALSDTVDVEKAALSLEEKAKEVLEENPEIGAIMLEGSKMAFFADSLKRSTGLPVFTSVTTSDFFTAACTSNPRFGLQGWQEIENET
eukprot:TRINITY_DN45607_c0_g1_i1.p1 TRINITY_DN45607_c0_g1~~TRINITY_DN45607_c0_g1_i1.p1  ORF type:complete len:616 (+),score=91.60 TRINITY_DN45607_c0_g1_i1:48-1895(+)